MDDRYAHEKTHRKKSPCASTHHQFGRVPDLPANVANVPRRQPDQAVAIALMRDDSREIFRATVLA